MPRREITLTEFIIGEQRKAPGATGGFTALLNDIRLACKRIAYLVGKGKLAGVHGAAGSGNVQVNYDRLVPDSAQGSMDDPRIQQLLLYAARNNENSGVRMDSINLLTRRPQDNRVREALMYALRYDRNPGVRLKALEGLGPYVSEDLRVRNAVLEALLGDSNPGLRIEAMRLLEAVKPDSSVRSAFRQLAEQDENDFIRRESRRVLATLPEMD